MFWGIINIVVSCKFSAHDKLSLFLMIDFLHSLNPCTVLSAIITVRFMFICIIQHNNLCLLFIGFISVSHTVHKMIFNDTFLPLFCLLFLWQ